MTKYHLKAIELRYNGHTYREISKAIGGKISEGSLEVYFSESGMLYIPFLTYQAKMNKWSEEHSKQQIKRMAAYTAEVRKTILKRALKTGDLRLALDTVKDIDDRAGNVVIRKTEVKEERKPISTYDEYVRECERLGVDPETGFTPGAKQTQEN